MNQILRANVHTKFNYSQGDCECSNTSIPCGFRKRERKKNDENIYIVLIFHPTGRSIVMSTPFNF